MTDQNNSSWLTIKPLAQPADGAPAIRLSATPVQLLLSAWLPVEGGTEDAHERAMRSLNLIAMGEDNLATFMCHPLSERPIFADEFTRERGSVGFVLALKPREAFALPALGQRYFIHAGWRHLRAEALAWTASHA